MALEAVTEFLSTPAAELGGITLVEANAGLAALGRPDVRRLVDVLDQRAAESGLLRRPPTERYLYLQGLLTLAPADRLSAIRASRYLSDSAKARFEQRVSNQTLIVLAPLTFSDLARILYYQALEYLEELGPGATFIPGAPRVLLLGPYKAGDPKIGQFLAPPLGVHRIASFLKLAGIPATVYDLDLYGERGYFDLIKRQRFDLIGFSMLEPTLPNEIRVMLRTAELSPASFLIAGGQGAAFNGEFLVENTPVDVVVRGFGEFATLDIAMGLALESIGPPDLLRIPAIYYRGEHDQIKRSRLLSTGISLEDLRLVSLYWDPADTPYQDYWRFIRGLYSDDHLRVMKTAKLTRTVRIYTESHCPMGCDFCSSTNQLGDAVTGGKQLLRLLSAADIVNIIKRVKKAHPQVGAVYFNDDNFFLSKRRVEDVARLLEANGLSEDLVFFALSRADNVDSELLALIRKAGFYMLIFGIESLAEHVLQDMEKKIRGRVSGKTQTEISTRAILDTLAAGLVPRMNLILFYPTVTPADLKLTIDQSVDLIAEGAIVDAFAYVEPYAGSGILEKGYEIEYEDRDFETARGTKRLRFPIRVKPEDPTVRRAAEEAMNSKASWLSVFKRRYGWSGGKLPAPVDALITFFTVYRALAMVTRDATAYSTERIESVIERLMRVETNPAMLLRDDPTNTYFEVGVEAEKSH